MRLHSNNKMTKTPRPTSILGELAYQKGYSQALEDYALTNLLETVKQIYPILTESESSLIAALLIKQSLQAINFELVSNYLHSIRTAHSVDAFTAPITLEYPQSLQLPNLLETPSPHYAIGDRVRLTPIDGASEWGTLIGYYLCYAAHRCQWMYRYILFLDQSSTSAAWVKATFAWEDEIECLLGEA